MPRIVVKSCKNCDGAAHDWEFSGAPTGKESRLIQAQTGFTFQEHGEAITRGDANAMAALLGIMHRRESKIIPFDDIDWEWDGIDMIDTDEEAAQARAAAGKDGDQADGSTPGP